MEDTQNQIPLLNSIPLQNLKDGSLVKFRGMIQDMHNPEFYFETFEIVNKTTKETRIASGKYKDTADISENEYVNYNSPGLKSAERHTMAVITIPGFSKWAQDIESESDICPKPSDLSSRSTNLKRSLDDSTYDEMVEADVLNSKKDCKKTPSTETDNSIVSREHILNFPVPDEKGKLCLIKVYDDFEALKLNDVIEVIGYLSVDPAMSNQWNGNRDDEINDFENEAEVLTHNPPPSLAPRIHATKIIKLEHCNPLLENGFNKESALKEANEAREHLRIALTQMLFGDSLAADYLICHLISQVFIRKDVITIGKLALNLWNIPSQQHPNYTDQLYSVIKNIVTKSYYLPLTIENLNTLSFIPKKDYECNRLTSGILQLSKNTHLVLDETKMLPGQLNSVGVTNLTTLGNVIQNQKVKYDFKFYEMEFECDIPVLIVSEGKSLLPNEISLPLVIDNNFLKISNEIYEAVNHYLNPTVLNKIRAYLTNMKLIEYCITEEPDYIQEDFVNMRKSLENTKETSADDLHRLLVLTRLVCLSRGYDSLNRECWNIAKEMEQQRYTRLNPN